MFSRGFVVCSILALATVAQGGVQVQLVPTPNQPGGYAINQVVQVDVKLAQSPGGSDNRLRMVEFDLQDTNVLLTVALPLTHDRGTPTIGDDIFFWSFSSLPNCVTSPSFCSFNHFVDDDLVAGPVDTRLNILSIAFRALTVDNTSQLFLPLSGAPLTVGKLQVTMPPLQGDFTLNLMNSDAPTDATGLDLGARVDFGFDPHTIWRSHGTIEDPTPDVSGGTYTFKVCNVLPCPGDVVPPPTSSNPAFTARGILIVPPNGTLWRSAGNVVRLTFPAALPGIPAAGQLLIQEMLAGGVAGPDLSASFAFTLESGNTVLRIRDGLTATPTATLLHRKWYVIRNTGGWTGVANFETQFPSQVGDAQGNNNVLGADVLTINGALTCISNCGDQNRKDINGDGRVLGADVLVANGKITSLPVAKPSGW